MSGSPAGSGAFAPGGLGNTRGSVEATYGKPDAGSSGNVATYQSGRYQATFEGDRLTKMVINFVNRAPGDALPLAEAKALGAKLAPPDVTHGSTFQRDDTAVDQYSSNALAQTFQGASFGGPETKPGSFFISFKQGPDGKITIITAGLGTERR